MTLLHGNNIVASRAKLIERVDEARGHGKEIRQLDGKTLNPQGLTQAVESSSLFGGNILVIIEGLLIKLGKKENLAVQLIDILKRSESTIDIILWEEKEIGKTLITLLGSKCSVELFKTPVVIFQLLDGISPAKTDMLVKLLRQALELDAAELIFALLVRRIRQLIQLRDNVTPEGLQGWQAGRLTSQAKSFTMDRLLIMEKRLLEIDVSMKTGTSPFPLAQQLELFIIDL